MADGEVNIRVKADTSDAEGKAEHLKRSLGSVADDAPNKAASALGRLKDGVGKAADAVKGAVSAAAKATAVAAGASVTAIVAKATEAYSSYEQLSGGVEKLFGDAAARVYDYADQAYVTAGLSANAYMEQVTGIASALKQSFGGDAVKAAESANMAIVDMSDNANVFGSDIRDIQNAYQGFAKQNYTMLDNLKLGYGGTKEEMQRLIDHANELERAQGRAGDLTIDKMGDVVQAIHDVQVEQGIAGDTAEEAADTIQGSLDMTKAAWENLLVALGSGEGVDQAVDQLMDSFGTLAQNVVPVMADVIDEVVANLPQLMDSIGSAIEQYGPQIGDSLVSAFVFAWNRLTDMVSGLGIQLPKVDVDGVKQALKDVEDGFDKLKDGVGKALDVLKDAAPVIAGVAAALVALKVVNAVASGFKTLSAVVTAATTALSMIQSAAGVGAVLSSLAGGPVTLVIAAIAAVVAALVTLYMTNEDFRNAVNGAWAAIQQAVGDAVSAIAGFFTDTLPQAFQSVSDFFTVTIPQAFQSFCDFMASLPETVLGFVEQLPMALATGAGLIVGVVLGLVVSLGEAAIEAGSAFLTNLVGFFTQLPGQVAAFLSEAAASALSWASEMASAAAQAGSDFLSGVVSFFTQLPGRIASFLSSALSSIASFVAQMPGRAMAAGQGFLDGIQGGFNSAVSFVQGIPGRIVGFFSGAGSWLVDSGRALLGGFVDGIRSGFQAARDAVSSGLSSIRSFFPFSPAKVGPFSGHGYTTFSGTALMRDFAGAISDAAPRAVSAARAVLSDVQGALSASVDLTGAPGLAYAPVLQPAAAPVPAGGGGTTTTYNISFDGVSVNSDAEMRQAIYDFLGEMGRIGAMNRG